MSDADEQLRAAYLVYRAAVLEEHRARETAKAEPSAGNSLSVFLATANRTAARETLDAAIIQKETK